MKPIAETTILSSDMVDARVAPKGSLEHLSQQEIAKRMKTTQGAVARLESGTTMPSTRTLKRFAAATGHRLKISFVPERA